jgi:hypothetical protein
MKITKNISKKEHGEHTTTINDTISIKIPIVNNYKYMGICLNNNLQQTNHIKKIDQQLEVN